MSAPRVSQRHRTAFLTGASVGLGRAFTEMLLAEGVQVWGTSRDPGRLDDLARAYPESFHPVALDLRRVDDVATVFQTADAAAGGFDLVVNNAGFGVFGEFVQTELATWQDQLDVMLTQPLRLSHLALGGLLARNRGTLVNISSLAAEFPLPFQSAYNVAKAGLTALSESLIIETAPTAVVVIDFRPGDYRTEFDRTVQRPASPPPRVARAWQAFEAMMRGGPPPAHAAATLRRALLRHRSGTVRTGRVFQAAIAPFLARFGSLDLKRRIQARYFDV